jgi:hypothetical protein
MVVSLDKTMSSGVHYQLFQSQVLFEDRILEWCHYSQLRTSIYAEAAMQACSFIRRIFIC